jgi:hypothetical protein
VLVGLGVNDAGWRKWKRGGEAFGLFDGYPFTGCHA